MMNTHIWIKYQSPRILFFTGIILALLVSGCADEGGASATITDVGSVEGIITDADTGAALSGATVNAGGKTDSTNANSVYSIASIEIGTRTITVNLSGYHD